MTQASDRNTQSKPAIQVTKTPAQEPVPVDGERFESLWLQFENEAGFSDGQLDDERVVLQEAIAALEARIAEKQEELAAVINRAESAKNQLRALLSARLSDDAILSAMRVEYKVRRTVVAKPRKDGDPSSPSDVDKQFVLDQLDAEGLSVPELRKLTGRELRFLRATLDSLVAEGRVIKDGEKAGAKFHIP